MIETIPNPSAQLRELDLFAARRAGSWEHGTELWPVEGNSGVTR